ncbi:Circadian clock protein kinase KaiC [Candidatus Bilamarchaeum dharawalense]|uniref:Circadian clock protein kinase KaiC n=1 Tax=Candidatus Bilamarchaeum dharawalense TaxID=2885759 RepID=A0A5E4LSB6_9ARCH|nr:Circadian clock protein kinase KaiC [Candidatus Bilamarchaeum dharawalense]
MERVFTKSGISGLDEVLGGGFLENSLITVSGPTGCGKSTLAAQFIHNGALIHNEPGLYISIEESRADFLFHNSAYKWDFPALERDRKFILLDYPIHEVDQIINQASAIQEIIATTGVKRVVIDSIMPIALFFKEDDERKRGFLKFIENLRKWKSTILIVSEDITATDSEHVPNTGYGIESFTDGWLNLFYRYDDRAMERNRYIEVLKLKGMSHSTKSYPIDIDENGLRVVLPAGIKIPLEEAKVGTVPTVQKPVKTPAKTSDAAAKIAAVKKRLVRSERV